ncbi:MAG: aromatic amino acid hydroxylase, partial [Verrucomicrobia bacterium]
MSIQSFSRTNKAVQSLPKHLLQFAVDQRYEEYTPVDHAVWRFIMRQNIFFLKEYAHKVYFQGLLDTGISFERIPRIEEMNDILGRIDWGAVAVDGFIPPAAFMEFQAYKVLVIACDMRQIHHIEYTPAPDIVHEAAGHAPIIVDREYSNYLQRFGEVGAKAMQSRKDFELYEAIRHLSILKELPNSDPKEVEEATREVERRQQNLGEPSEMALLSRLHWWTVEYGLIGTLENSKIYGAGLLSSIGESVSCLEPKVKKIWYSIDAQNQPFDITTRQPQLFVCRDFQHLRDVLEEFANAMAYRVGGLEGINKAIECNNIATCEYS